ncbi:Rad54b, partial [Symbiodinium necroappetens]
MSGGATFQTIANELKPCRVSALIYDAEALQCNSVPELAACYNRRVLADSGEGEAQATAPIIVAGYSYGCVLAHQMGLQLHKAGVHVGVVMFDLEVTWPPPESNDRIDGYKFLGGEAEAILLISRALGKFDFAMKEAVELNRILAESGSIDVDALHERAFEHLAQRGMSKELFTQLVKRGGTNIQQLHTIADPWEPSEVLDSPALLVLAPDSMEFATAREINEKFCTQMEVVHGKGSHYNMMQ